MKVKNIMFSGVMAAILGATAAHADPVQLISKTYADNNLQAKLTQANNAGDNVTISEDGKIGVNLTNYATNTAVTNAITNALAADGEVTAAIDAAVANKQEKLDNAEVLSGITAEELAGYDKAVTDSAAALTNAATAQSAAETAQSAAETAQGAVDALETVVEGKAAQADLTALTSRVSTNETNISANTAAIEKLNAGVEVEGSVDYKIKELNDSLASTGDNVGALSIKVDTIDGRLETAEGEIDALQNATANLDDFIDETEIQAYATTEALAGVKATAEQGVADAAAAKAAADAAKAAADEAQADADANATAIEGKVDSIGAGKAGSYIIDFDADGKASYTQITII